MNWPTTAWGHSAQPRAQIHRKTVGSASQAHLGSVATSPFASATCGIHAAHARAAYAQPHADAARARAHADAASQSPFAPASDASAPVPLMPAHASVSPDAQASHSPSQILRQTHLERRALLLLLISEYRTAA